MITINNEKRKYNYMKKILYYDYLRIIAILGVIMIHVTSEYTSQITTISYGYVSVFVNCMVSAWAVPIFVTISGSLLLDKETFTISKMIKKYIPRILFCLVFWACIYFFYQKGVINFEIIKSIPKSILTGRVFSHLWYLYLTIGLYLLTPILRKLVKCLTKKEYLYLLILGFSITVVIPWLDSFVSFDLNKLIQPYRVFEMNRFLFYYLLGYYLKKYVNIIGLKYLILSIFFLLVVSIYSTYMSYINHKFISYSGTWSLVSIFVVISLFSFFKTKYNTVSKPFASLLGDLTFGVYLTHFIVERELLKIGIDANFINPFVGNLFTPMLILCISYMLCYAISKIPYVKKIIGL